jgi:hypothetical protein
VEVSRSLRRQMLAGPQARRIGGTRSEVKAVTQTGGPSPDQGGARGPIAASHCFDGARTAPTQLPQPARTERKHGKPPSSHQGPRQEQTGQPNRGQAG